MIWALVIERQLFVIRKVTLKVLPKGSSQIKVLQIGDIHLAPWQKGKQRFLTSLGRLEIDLVVNTGDNLGHQKSIEPLLRSLGPLLQRPGVFVHGSNDYFAPIPKNPLNYLFHNSKEPKSKRLDTAKLTAGFEMAGWVNLNNKSAELEVSGNRIGFLGVDDYHIGYSDLEGITESENFTIALTHAPYLAVIEKFTRSGAELIFAGHTHGGQFRLPLIGALTTNSDLPNRYARGTSNWKFGERKSVLSVVAGLGNSIYAPIRFFCLPEVRLITLSARD
jgi:uncharacterized protein